MKCVHGVSLREICPRCHEPGEYKAPWPVEPASLSSRLISSGPNAGRVRKPTTESAAQPPADPQFMPSGLTMRQVEDARSNMRMALRCLSLAADEKVAKDIRERIEAAFEVLAPRRPSAEPAEPDAFERGRQQGMKQERALWELAKNSQELDP